MQRQVFVCDDEHCANCKATKEALDQYVEAADIEIVVISEEIRSFLLRHLIVYPQTTPEKSRLSCPVFIRSSVVDASRIVRQEALRFLGVWS